MYAMLCCEISETFGENLIRGGMNMKMTKKHTNSRTKTTTLFLGNITEEGPPNY